MTLYHRVIPIRVEQGDFVVCPICANQETDACDDCENADQFEQGNLEEIEENAAVAA